MPTQAQSLTPSEPQAGQGAAPSEGRRSAWCRQAQDSAPMEAAEPQHGAPTAVPAIADFGVAPEALMRSGQTPAVGLKGQEGQVPSYKWAEGRRLLELQQRDLRDVNDCAAESMTSVPKDAPADVETDQENLMTEAWDTPECQEAVPQSPADGQPRARAPPELWACPVQGDHLDKVPVSSELSSTVEVEVRPELASLVLGTGQAEEEESSADTGARTRCLSSWEEHPAETNPPQDSGSGTVRHGEELQPPVGQRSPGRGGLVCPQEAEGLEEQGPEEVDCPGGGVLGEADCSDGLFGGQEQVGEQVNGTEGGPRQKQEQSQDDAVPARPGGRGGLNGELGGLNYEVWQRRAQGQEGLEQREQRTREFRGPGESRVHAQHEETQSLVGKSVNVAGRQEAQGPQGTVMPAEAPEQWEGAARGGQGGAPGVPSPCDSCPDVCNAMVRRPGPQTAPTAEDLFPEALTPPLGPTGRSRRPICLPSVLPTGESPDQGTVQDGQPARAELGKEAVPSWGPEGVSGSPPVTPPGTLDAAPPRPAEGSLPASAPVAIPRKAPSLAACSPETSGASLLTESPSPCGSLPGFPSAEATLDPWGCPAWASPQSPLVNCAGAVQPLRSNSFSGFHRTELSPDLAGRSLSFSHSELPQRPPKPAVYGSVILRRHRKSSRGCGSIPEASASPATLGGGAPELPSRPERPSSPRSGQPWGSPHNPPFAPGPPAYGSSPPLVFVDGRAHEPAPPLPPQKRHVYPAMVESDGHPRAVAPTHRQCSYPPALALGPGLHGPPRGPLPEAPDSLVARQYRPLPSTPDNPHHPQTSSSPRSRYNKPLPPTPDLSQPHHSPISSDGSPRIYKPLPPVPVVDPLTEPPPLPPKSRGRDRSTQGGLMNSGGHAKPRPVCQEQAASIPHAAGRTSWPPAVGRSDSLASTIRSKSEVAPVMAFSNVTALLSPSSPTTPWTLELRGAPSEPGLSKKPEARATGSLRRPAPPEGAQSLRASDPSGARQPGRPGHPPLEKASSWPHRRDAGRPLEGAEQAAASGEGSQAHKGWHRQGLRRPSVLPVGSLDTRGPALEKSSSSSDAIVFREKKPKEVMGGFSRRCSKLINSSQLLYQEYSDVVLNKEIQSQQRPDSSAEAPGPASPRQPRKILVSSESYLQRLSMAPSASLWQEIPIVRNSTVLLSMTHEDQKLQEAKFELIVSEASYLRSLNIAVDHFQHSSQLRAILSNQDQQWLFSRLQDVRDVSATFLSDLEENFENNIFTFHVCDVVLNHASDFRRVYLPYVTNQTYQERTFQNLLNTNSSFREVLEKLESDPVCQRLSLKSFLILPFQRITRLKLLLQNILKRTQPGSSEEAEATKAHHALEELIRDCNNNVQRMRRTEELIYLSQKIEFECKIFPLISQSRWLVKSGELTALEFSVSPGLRRKLNTRPIHLHLFNDCLLLSRPREGSRFLVFDHAPFSAIRGEKCEMKLHGPHKNLFRLFLLHNTQGTQAEFLFRTETQSEKLRWISALAMPREELDLLECCDSQQVQCLRAYKPRENDELALEKADVVMVTQQSSDGWLEGVRLSDGERGWFPMQQVEFISNPDVRARNLKEAQRVKTAKLQLVEQQT
ncbi:PREDICTED: rho guanine nucleotide exchange factor 5 isoform X2 [Hipposideros armiger]|uniref:Rho guanine nucleotide exchange factor 5 isoform X2 n=1 Tax=Hipposideros armiger TaxID=186990 RepID=A0A8B7Q7Q8_HIPAR|nr:PREDICTED: rho guanine nucleotide exchange factor 5 isoform X2 [Hipposideros armiger]